MDDPIIIERKTARKGDDGYKVVSVRIREEVIAELDALAEKSNRSRNDIINRLLIDGIKRAIVK